MILTCVKRGGPVNLTVGKQYGVVYDDKGWRLIDDSDNPLWLTDEGLLEIFEDDGKALMDEHYNKKKQEPGKSLAGKISIAAIFWFIGSVVFLFVMLNQVYGWTLANDFKPGFCYMDGIGSEDPFERELPGDVFCVEEARGNYFKGKLYGYAPSHKEFVEPRTRSYRASYLANWNSFSSDMVCDIPEINRVYRKREDLNEREVQEEHSE